MYMHEFEKMLRNFCEGKLPNSVVKTVGHYTGDRTHRLRDRPGSSPIFSPKASTRFAAPAERRVCLMKSRALCAYVCTVVYTRKLYRRAVISRVSLY